MTRAGGGWRYLGGAPKIFRHPKGGHRKFVYFKTNGRVGAPKKLNRLRGGLLKFQASIFNIFIPPLPYQMNFPLQLLAICEFIRPVVTTFWDIENVQTTDTVKFLFSKMDFGVAQF